MPKTKRTDRLRANVAALKDLDLELREALVKALQEEDAIQRASQPGNRDLASKYNVNGMGA